MAFETFNGAKWKDTCGSVRDALEDSAANVLWELGARQRLH